MCAIAGLYAFAPSAPPADRAELRTTDPMSARGPDGFGEWFSNDGRVAFGHRRLAIIDLTEGGAQPMTHTDSAGNQLFITFNGEIDNYRELRQEFGAIAAAARRRPRLSSPHPIKSPDQAGGRLSASSGRGSMPSCPRFKAFSPNSQRNMDTFCYEKYSKGGLNPYCPATSDCGCAPDAFPDSSHLETLIYIDDSHEHHQTI